MVEASHQNIDPELFVRAVQPALQAQDLQGLLALLKSRWTGPQIIGLLRGKHEDARKVAALCLSLVGTNCCVSEIAKLLRDGDPTVNQMAEHALWSIWFRAGPEPANHQLARGAQALERRDYEHAITHFDRALQIAPDFAEAYNQRALARYLLEQYAASLVDCHATVRLMPCHFGAWAGTGHNHTHLGDLKKAMEAYARALEINPHMSAVRQALGELHDRAGR